MGTDGNDIVAIVSSISPASAILDVQGPKVIYATNVGSWVVPGILCAAVYLVMSLPLSHLARRLERRWSVA